MKKKLAVVLAGVMMVSATLAGCQGSKGLETDDLKITQYKGIEVDAVEKAAEVTDEDIDKYIESRLSSDAESIEVTDRAVQSGDTATIDFTGKMNGEAFEGGTSTDYPLEIGSGSFIPGFEDSIIGHNTGDTFDWNGKFPDSYGNADLAGKDVVFTITVKKIQESKLPELTDEYVQKISEESKNVDEYKKEVKKNLEKQNADTYEETLINNTWKAVIENTEVKNYPMDEVEKIRDGLVEQYKTIASYNGAEYEDMIEQQMGKSVEEFEKELLEAAKENVKQTMATKAIAEKEKIEIDDESYKKQLQELAEMYGYESGEQIKEEVEKEDLETIVLNTLVKKWLADNCIQKVSK